MIREDFLHYLWKYKYFAIQKLRTCDDELLEILQVGQHNFNSGPDFFNAKLRIGEQLWAGNIEIHVKASDWYVHHHEIDPNYDNVILHVVWENDINIYQKNNIPIPTLELKPIVSTDLIVKYQHLFSKQSTWINCENQFSTVSKFVRNNWLEKLYFDRMEQKSDFIFDLLKNSENDWEAVLFKMLTMNFGLKVNKESFFNLANSIDFRIIRKERFNVQKLEAVLFGQAGFLLDNFQDAYFQELKKEYNFIQLKYKLEPINKNQFNFFRLRPNNFPTIRIAQLAGLYHTQNNLFSKIVSADTLQDLYRLFNVGISNYWKHHYIFSSKSINRPNKLANSFIDLLIINTIIPIKFSYFKQIGRSNEDLFLSLSKEMTPEKNSIVDKFKSLPFDLTGSNIVIQNSFESQAYLQLKNKYCDKQNCMQCAIGNALLKT